MLRLWFSTVFKIIVWRWILFVGIFLLYGLLSGVSSPQKTATAILFLLLSSLWLWIEMNSAKSKGSIDEAWP